MFRENLRALSLTQEPVFRLLLVRKKKREREQSSFNGLTRYGILMGVDRLITFSRRLVNKEDIYSGLRLFVEADQLAERLDSTFTLPAIELEERLPVSCGACTFLIYWSSSSTSSFSSSSSSFTSFIFLTSLVSDIFYCPNENIVDRLLFGLSRLYIS